MTLSPLGDRALLITVATEVGDEAATRVQGVTQAVTTGAIAGVEETVPGILSVAVFLDATADRARVTAAVEALLANLPAKLPPLPAQHREIPVCYGGEFGPDLARVASHAKRSEAAMIKAHSRPEYRVQAIGFSPGFPYLSGLPAALHTPRRTTPRPRVVGGSVGIGGAQTGIYPMTTPGGWQIIGRTPRLLFEPTAEPPSWLRPGDTVRFKPVERAEYDALELAGAEARKTVLRSPSEQTDGREPVFEVLRPGVQTTVQDLGRVGWQVEGVPVGGAADTVALQIGNLLVGNNPGAAALEWARQGPTLRVLIDTVVAVTGVELETMKTWRPQRVRAGEVLQLAPAVRGMRGYLAVAGGVEVPRVLNSRSTCLAGRFGGHDGRALATGDVISAGAAESGRASEGWFVGPYWLADHTATVVARLVRGPHADRFSAVAWRVLTESTFQAQADSDRRALRLQGAKLALEEPEELISGPVAAGAVQVPPDGQPAVLLADRQTLGGYPQIGYVITADLPRLAQMRPGDRLRFLEVTLDEADQARAELERDLGLLRIGLAGRTL